MSKIRRKYSKEQKLEIVKMSLDEGQSVVDISERYDISANTVYNWRSKYFKYEKDAFPGHGNKMQTEEQKEVRRLKKELRETQLERDILKKAVGIFSKGDSKYSNL